MLVLHFKLLLKVISSILPRIQNPPSCHSHLNMFLLSFITRRCNECNKVFADKQCLKNHMIRHESDDAKLFRCEHCPRRFPKQYLLDQHKFIHTPQEERQYFCEDCGKAYVLQSLMKRITKKYLCIYCFSFAIVLYSLFLITFPGD